MRSEIHTGPVNQKKKERKEKEKPKHSLTHAGVIVCMLKKCI